MPDRSRQPKWMLTSLLAIFLVARIVVAAGGHVFVAYDSFSYRLDPTLNRGPVVSLTGDAPRLWGVPLFYALFATDRARAYAQWTVGTVAWVALAWAIWGWLRHLLAKVVAAAGVLVLGLLGPVTNWDFAILSESLSISLGVLVLAFVLRWLATGSRWALAGLTAGAVWWLFTRPEVRLMVGLLLLAIAGYALRTRLRRVGAACCAAVLLLAMGWAMAITPRVERTFAGWSATGLPLGEETLLFRLRLQVLPDQEVTEVYRTRLGMPDCPGANQVAAGTEWAIREFADAYRACPQLKAWGERNATSSGYRFPIVAPATYLRVTAAVLPRAFEGAQYAQVPHVSLADRLVFPPHEYEPYWLLAGLAVVVGLVLGTGAWRRRGVPDALAGAAGPPTPTPTSIPTPTPIPTPIPRRLIGVALVVAAGSVGSVLGSLLFSAGEYARFGIQEAVGVRLALLLAVVAALDAAVHRRLERIRPPRADGRVDDLVAEPTRGSWAAEAGPARDSSVAEA